MKLLFDTNVVLDLLLDRTPWAWPAAQLFTKVERGEVEGCLCATTLTTIHYFGAKAVGARAAQQQIENLLLLCSVAPVTGQVVVAALKRSWPDFEDAVLHESARQAGASTIVTRNLPDFQKAELPVMGPRECLGSLS